ncbi:hypothetical protein G8A07_00245 [Roseateles sp. DAIF2]|uniref:DUF5691 domain-containing protein n=1 Tax=Roseateles sp. DAIF2 TaxID=2714952 RepID=UPI0018A2EF79|nr:DUF5691 domain-containing protein [Roseateles sp. DAIF2]QPF71501.1 hypothetical protein G8A07_00245 [Roseateles sp. DAIF2]
MRADLSIWTALLPAAMVGTDRQALPTAWPGAVGALAQQAAAAAPDPAGGLLRAAAVLASCGLAGAQGRPWPHALPEPAGAETRPAVQALAGELRWALEQGPPRLQHECLLQIARAGLRLPQPLLPLALEQGRRSLALRAALLPTLGSRGLWLAAQNPDWSYAAGVTADRPDDDERCWSEGRLDQRLAFLRGLRARDPAAGRERLRGVLADLPAKERVELGGALAIGLGPDDEPLLDQLRTDRSREVRQMAIGLLLRLPQAALVQRAQARLGALLQQERVLLRKRWVLQAPQQPEPDWKADNLDTPRPQHESLGERAWWLYQLVRQVPLAWWTASLAMTPDALMSWAGQTDWQEALLRGWRDVLRQDPRDEWTEALLPHWPRNAWNDDRAGLLSLLPRAARERHWQAQLGLDAQALPTVIQQCLEACPAGETLSPGLSAELVERLRRALADPQSLQNDYLLRSQLPELACMLHPQQLPTMATLHRPIDATPSLAQTLQTVTQVAQLRLALSSLPSSS